MYWTTNWCIRILGCESFTRWLIGRLCTFHAQPSCPCLCVLHACLCLHPAFVHFVFSLCALLLQPLYPAFCALCTMPLNHLYPTFVPFASCLCTLHAQPLCLTLDYTLCTQPMYHLGSAFVPFTPYLCTLLLHPAIAPFTPSLCTLCTQL